MRSEEIFRDFNNKMHMLPDSKEKMDAIELATALKEMAQQNEIKKMNQVVG
jgi:hypothetical protein